MSSIQYQGKIEKQFPSRFGGGSFALEGQRGLYFNSKTPLPAYASVGASVSFTGEIGANGKSVFVQEGTLAQVAQGATPAVAYSTGGPNTNDRIGYQSSRKDALVMVNMLLSNGALVLPAAAGKKAGVVEAAVDRFTASYFQDIETLGALDRATQEAPKAVKAAKTAVVEEESDEEELAE